MLGANAFFFLALQSIPLVTASAVVFVGPLIVTALSVPLLGERVGPRRWAAVAVGFVGAMLIIRPGTDFMHAATVLPLLAALSFSFYQICTRVLASHDDPMTTLTYTAIAGSVATTAIVPSGWITPDTVGWIAMIAAGIFGALGQWALIKAISAAPVNTVAPFGYTGLVWATLFGFVTFGDVPDVYTLSGAVIIAASGLYVLHRERAVSRSATARWGQTTQARASTVSTPARLLGLSTTGRLEHRPVRPETSSLTSRARRDQRDRISATESALTRPESSAAL